MRKHDTKSFEASSSPFGYNAANLYVKLSECYLGAKVKGIIIWYTSKASTNHTTDTNLQGVSVMLLFVCNR